jgi:hypothetical protein
MKFWILVLFPLLCFAQIIPPALQTKIQDANLKHEPLLIATSFKGLPYKAHALSKENPEKFVVEFGGFDCVTFVENVWSLYRSKGVDSIFLTELKQIRYGQMPISFENRNHYLSATFAQMEDKGLFKPVIPASFLILANKNLDYLSNFLVPKNLLITIPAIQSMEKNLGPLTYVPRTNFSLIMSYLKSGDIIAFVSKRKDLDYQHVGFVREVKGNYYLVHASQDRMQVCQSVESISVYLKNHPNMLGFNVFRPEYER